VVGKLAGRSRDAVRVCHESSGIRRFRDEALPRLAATQHGVVSSAQLLRLGFDRHAINRLLRAGRLHRLHRGVYALGHPGITDRGLFLSAVFALGEGAVLSHASAAALWGFRRNDDSQVHVTVASNRRGRSGIRVHRVTELPVNEWTRRENIPITTPARTLLDLAATLPYKPLRSAVRRAEVEKRVSHPQLEALLDAHPNARGARTLRQILEQGPAPTRSSLEDEVLDRLIEAGLPRPETNARTPAGEVDFLWPEHNVVLEVDGPPYHEGPLADEVDYEKTERLTRAGLTVVRARP
jgi:very-short-patch-repair endonuclease